MPGPVRRRAESSALLRSILEPRSVAVVGASDDLRKPGARVLRSILAHGFEGEVFPVSLHAAVVQGLPAFPSLAALPSTPEVAIVSVPAPGALQVFRECADLGVPTVIMLTAFEAGERESRDELARLSAEAPGTRLLGPSSLGAHGSSARFAGTFATATEAEFRFSDSDVVIISQSGGVGAYLLSAAHAAGLPVGGFISTGVEADLTLAELLRAAVDRDPPALVCAYLEGAADATELADALECARDRGVPVLLLRGGSTGAGRAAAQRHSGLPQLDDVAWRTEIDPTAACTVDSVEEMVDAARAIAHPVPASGRRLTIVAASGGAGVLMSDATVRAGFSLAEWTAEEASGLAALLPGHAALANPIDATGALFSPLRTLGRVLSLCAEHAGTDVVVLSVGNMPHVDDRLFQEIAAVAGATQKLVAVVWAGGSADAIRRLADVGVLAFSDPVRCARALDRAIRQGHPAGSHA